MNNKCKNFRQRTKTINKKRTLYLYCTKQKIEIQYDNCKGCHYKEYKEQKCTKLLKNSAKQEKKTLKIAKTVQKTAKNNRKLQSSAKMNQKSRKLAKLERERFSLFTDNKDKCMFCPSTYKLTWHEIYCGRNRQNSMKYGLCLRMCLFCHDKYQEDKLFNEEWHIKGQKKFIETYSDLKFEDIFRINYL